MKSFEDIHRDGVTARVVSEYKERVTAALFNEIELEPVSRGGRGELYRFELADGYGLIRPYRRGGLIRFILHDRYLLQNRPLRELEILRELHGNGLPVPAPLGARWQRAGSFYSGSIATSEIAGQNLLEVLAGNPPERAEILRLCGEAICTIHDAGVLHGDLQVENLFAGYDGITILDFDKARVLKQLSAWQRMRNLLRLARSMRKRGLPEHDFDAICEGYGQHPRDHRVLNALDRLAHRRHDRGARRPGPSHGIRTERVEMVWTVETRSAGNPNAVLRLIDEPGELLKPPSTWSTRRVGDYVVKQFRVRSFADVWRQAIDRHRFRRAWNVAHSLQQDGVDTPEPCAYLEYRRFGCVLRSATLTRYLEGAINVEEAARNLNADGAMENIQTFLASLADAINRLEQTDHYHADLSGKNILTLPGDELRFFFIDLDSVHHGTRYTDEARIKNHVQLYDSFCDMWDDALLRPFIARLLPKHYDEHEWFGRVKHGQRERRTRQIKRWRKQGRD